MHEVQTMSGAGGLCGAGQFQRPIQNAYNQSNPQSAERLNVSVQLTVTGPRRPFCPRYPLAFRCAPRNHPVHLKKNVFIHVRKVEKIKFTHSAHNLFFLLHCPLLSWSVHMRKLTRSTQQQQGRDGQKDGKDAKNAKFTPAPALSFLCLFSLFHLHHLRSLERQPGAGGGPMSLTASRSSVAAERRRSVPPRGPAC